MLNDGNLHMKLVLLLLVTMFYHLLVLLSLSRHVCTLHTRRECFPFAAIGTALSIQLKRFLFLFHIYVKIHFVFYSNAWVSLRIYIYLKRLCSMRRIYVYGSIHSKINQPIPISHIPAQWKLGSHLNGLREKTYVHSVLYTCVIERARAAIQQNQNAKNKEDDEKKNENGNENKNPRHNTLTKTRHGNGMVWITVDMTSHRNERSNEKAKDKMSRSSEETKTERGIITKKK